MEWFIDSAYTLEMIVSTARMVVGLGVIVYGIKVALKRETKLARPMNKFEGAALIAAGALLMWRWV